METVLEEDGFVVGFAGKSGRGPRRLGVGMMVGCRNGNQYDGRNGVGGHGRAARPAGAEDHAGEPAGGAGGGLAAEWSDAGGVRPAGGCELHDLCELGAGVVPGRFDVVFWADLAS